MKQHSKPLFDARRTTLKVISRSDLNTCRTPIIVGSAAGSMQFLPDQLWGSMHCQSA